MNTQATGLYPFIPSGANFERAIQFFAEVGFETAWRTEGLAGLRFGSAYFLLQDINVPVWQENQMIVLEVADLDAFWAEVAAKDLPARFPGTKFRPPTDFPWGREVHFIDPAGVCWHVRQAKSGA